MPDFSPSFSPVGRLLPRCMVAFSLATAAAFAEVGSEEMAPLPTVSEAPESAAPDTAPQPRPMYIRQGIVTLQAEENPVGRLRVRGAKFTSPQALTSQAQSMEEGKPVDFTKLTDEIMAMNQVSGRTVTPKLNAGVVPGTVDVDLEVTDELPAHGSLELNNR